MRTDGRQTNQLRPVKMTINPNKHAEDLYGLKWEIRRYCAQLQWRSVCPLL